MLRDGFCVNPKISIRIKILLTVSRRSLASYQWHSHLSLHLPSPIPLGDLWCARQRIDIPRYLFLRQSIRSFPKESVNFLFIRFSRHLAEFIRFALSTSSKPRIFSSKLPQKYRIIKEIADLGISLWSRKMVAVTFWQLISRDVFCNPFSRSTLFIVSKLRSPQ